MYSQDRASEAFYVSGTLLGQVPPAHHFEVFLTYVRLRCIADGDELVRLAFGRSMAAGRGG